MKMIVDCITADIPTRNGRIYSTSCLNEAIDKFNENKTKHKVGFGGFGHTEPFEEQSAWVNPEQASHLVNSVFLNEDGKIELDIKVLSTKKGMFITKLLKEGMKLEIAPRIVGTLNEDNSVNISNILCFDLILPDK